LHEYSIIGALVEQVEAETRARGGVAVHGVGVRIGELSGVDCELLASAYEIFRPATICARAPLTIERVPARFNCGRCGRAIAAGEILRCPDCGGEARLSQGDEILLMRIEMEVH